MRGHIIAVCGLQQLSVQCHAYSGLIHTAHTWYFHFYSHLSSVVSGLVSPGTTPNSRLKVSIIISRSTFVLLFIHPPCSGCEPFTQVKYDSLRAPVFLSHSWRCFWWMWFADLSKQSRLHCQNFQSIWTTITLFRIKAACISIYIYKTSP